jgi:hypothetical protein
MSRWANADLTEYNSEDTRSDQERIETDHHAVPCRICESAFRRLRLTLQYCNKCGWGFCQGEHGNFAFGGGTCVRCGPHPKRR